VFGMGTGVAPPALPPGKTNTKRDAQTRPPRRRTARMMLDLVKNPPCPCVAPRPAGLGLTTKNIEVVKPHDRLVLVSSMHCCTSTSSLSTT
jgi:hypothetical protein